MRARYKGPAGTGVLTLDDAATVGQVFDEIRSQSGIADFTLKYGWPLKTLDASQKAESAKSLGLNGETFTIVPSESTTTATATATATAPSAEAPASSSLSGLSLNRDTSSSFGGPEPPAKGPEGVSIPWPDRQGTLLLRVMPDDNSCLFTAFGGALPRQLPAPELRKMVAEYILAHPDEYNEAVLAMAPHEYARAIQGKDRWGGAIELAIFSDLFDVEICTFDVKGQSLLTFGENKDTRCLLVYSGIHYDRVALSPSEPPHTHSDLPPELDQTMWPTSDDEVLAMTRQLVAELNRMHYYTDPSEILLRCDAPGCDWMGSGERAGRQHAEQTGHTALSEIEDNALLKCNAFGCDWLGSGEREAKKHTSDTGHGSLSVIPDF